jgi:hypothetical protein
LACRRAVPISQGAGRFQPVEQWHNDRLTIENVNRFDEQLGVIIPLNAPVVTPLISSTDDGVYPFTLKGPHLNRHPWFGHHN